MEHKTFATIVNDKKQSGEKLTYLDELSAFEWKEKRLLIINRDKNICTNCKSEPTQKIYGRPHRKKTSEEEQIYINEMQGIYNKDYKRLIEELFTGHNQLIPNIINKIEIPFHPVDKDIILHVHHKYYINYRLAWEYSNDALITLCQTCHQDLHNKTQIPVYINEQMLEQLHLTKCPKCNGSGYLNEYDYYLNGICFNCDGYKYLELKK
jgi:5-methylcytosine-specific restriction endonuclease McrA